MAILSPFQYKNLPVNNLPCFRLNGNMVIRLYSSNFNVIFTTKITGRNELIYMRHEASVGTGVEPSRFVFDYLEIFIGFLVFLSEK